MLATLIPLFDENMAVKAYSLFAQKENFLRNPALLGTGCLDGAGNILGLEIIQNLGISTLMDDQIVFVEISEISVFSAIDEECDLPHERVVLLIGKSIPASEKYIARLKELKDKGYMLALHGVGVERFAEYGPIIGLVDYMMLDYKKINMNAAKNFFMKYYPNVKLIAANVNSKEDFELLSEGGTYALYEGDFFRLPVTKGASEVSPLKVNYLELLRVVNDSDFELTKAADIIGRDTALVIALLRMVNHMTVNSEITSIRHAAAMLGQRELKKWINTAVTKQLCADKPNEITRLSLLRAKFAENLSGLFEMAGLSQELFLMGLFSVLDIILDKPIKDALAMVNVSKQINDAIVEGKGDMAKVLDFIVNYEVASWSELSRLLIVYNMDEKPVYDAYVDALKWYRELFGDD